MKKKFYLSKTLWVMAIAFGAALIQEAFGEEVIDAKLQATIIAAIGVALRLITHEELDWTL